MARGRVLEAGALRRLVPARDQRVGVERVVRHPAVHAAINERRDAEHAAASLVERTWLPEDALRHLSCGHKRAVTLGLVGVLHDRGTM